jgi:hypothetical protein
MTPGGDKNGADINLALDALEMAFTHTHINAYVIVGGDSDFLSLVEKLKQYDKKVFVVGGRAFTSVILQRNCHEFIAYENLSGVRKTAAKIGRPMPAAAASAPIAQAVPIVRRALKILADREVSPQTGLLKSTLLQLDSTFSERNYGASSFLDFVEKLAEAGLVTMKHACRSVMVELNPSAGDEADAAAQAGPKARAADEAQPGEAAQGTRPESETRPPADHRPAENGRPAGEPEVRQTESAEAGVQRAGAILTAAAGARWPMYLRNVKQILRQAEGGFDERRYGFGGLMDLLKACQREGFVRIERDRRGGLRVFQGQALQRQTQPSSNVLPPGVPIEQGDAEAIEMQPGQSIEPSEPLDAELPEDGPMPIDTTAELLGRAKHRKPRTRAPRPILASAPRRAAPARNAAKKAATPRRTSRKKPAATESNDE